MDKLPSFGTAIGEVIGPTVGTYIPLVTKNASAIKSTPVKTFTYGANPRQQLDVYYPSSDTEDTSSPVLVFCYGGGLVRGERILAQIPDGLVYANVGHFFANLGYRLVIVDYRLIEHGAKFPSGGEDISLAVKWIQTHLATGGRKPVDLFMMGNSAGGVHLATYLFAPQFSQPRATVMPGIADAPVVLRGAIFLSAPFHWGDADPARSEVLNAYYGDRIQQDAPLGLLKTARQAEGADVLPGVKVLVLKGTIEPEKEILVPIKDFVAEWKAGEASDAPNKLEEQDVQGHNHISPMLALGTGIEKEEAWGFQADRFCKSAVTPTSGKT